MSAIDEILWLLRDGEWHDLKEITEKIALPKFKAEIAVSFLWEYDFIELKENVRIIQDLGIEILGFFVIGWDEDTPQSYRRTLDFCDEMSIIPFILTLTPMPGSQIYDEYLDQGRIFSELSWDYYGGESVVFNHPRMSPDEMYELNAEVMHDGYSMGRILSRTFHTLKKKPSLGAALNSFFTQRSLKNSFRQQIKEKGGRVYRPKTED